MYTMEKKRREDLVMEEIMGKVFQEALRDKVFELTMVEAEAAESLSAPIIKTERDEHFARFIAFAGFKAGVRFMLKNQPAEESLPFA